MNIFCNLKNYQRLPRKYSPGDSEPRPRKSLKEKLSDLFERTLMIWFIGALLLTFGLLWYHFSFQFCGMMFFGLLAFLSFGLLTGGFAKSSGWLEKKFGESKGMALGCLGMLLGPVAAVAIIVTSIPWWDHESHYEQQVSPTVYYTRYGECYHSTPYCFHIKGHDMTSVSEVKAEKKGLRPCSDCH